MLNRQSIEPLNRLHRQTHFQAQQCYVKFTNIAGQGKEYANLLAITQGISRLFCEKRQR